jgi:hypothetical protein
MKSFAMVGVILVSRVLMMVFAQDSWKVQVSPPVSNTWVDPSIGLMWAGRDNGKDLSWKKAVKYCRDLRLAGYSDWRLGSLGELEGIYDKNANSAGESPRSRWHDAESMTFHVKGNLFLTGNEWTSSQRMDDRGRPSGYAWRYDFNEGREFDGDELSFSINKRALCVRGPVESSRKSSE